MFCTSRVNNKYIDLFYRWPIWEYALKRAIEVELSILAVERVDVISEPTLGAFW